MDRLRVDYDKSGLIALDQLTDFQGNLKDLPEENYSKFKAEVLELGFSEPISVWENKKKIYILNGHQRVKALTRMKEEGIAIPKIPVNFIKATDLKQAKKKVLALTSQFGVLSKKGLFDFMTTSGLKMDDIKSSFVFPDINLESFENEFFKPTSNPETDDNVPTVPKNKKVRLGDLWKLGSHRLVCGDATRMEDVTKLVGDTPIQLVITDPPYNVAVNSASDYNGGSNPRNRRKDQLAIQNDSMSEEDFKKFLDSVFANYAKVMKPGAAIYVFYADSMTVQFINAFTAAGFHFAQNCIWNKQQFVMTRKDYHYKHEPVLYGWREGGPHIWSGDRKQSSVWDFDRPFKSEFHPTTKPIALIEYPMMNSSVKGGAVLDLFGGSGSTLIASEKCERKCFMMELDPHFCAVILERWSQFTGQDPVREDGVKWSKLKTKSV